MSLSLSYRNPSITVLSTQEGKNLLVQKSSSFHFGNALFPRKTRCLPGNIIRRNVKDTLSDWPLPPDLNNAAVSSTTTNRCLLGRETASLSRKAFTPKRGYSWYFLPVFPSGTSSSVEDHCNYPSLQVVLIIVTLGIFCPLFPFESTKSTVT